MNKKIITLALASAALMLTGCKVDGKVTGGGTFDGVFGGKNQANYGFTASECDGKTQANFHFNDKDAGVKFKSIDDDFLTTGLCDSANGTEDNFACFNYCVDGEYTVEFNYESLNKDFPGTGIAGACLTDGGEGVNEGDGVFGDDTVDVYVESGPFAGYRNFQFAGTGNVQSHDCPSTKN